MKMPALLGVSPLFMAFSASFLGNSGSGDEMVQAMPCSAKIRALLRCLCAQESRTSIRHLCG